MNEGDQTGVGFDEEEKQVERDGRLVTAALSEVGIRVQSVWDLVNTSRAYPEAVPVLLRFLREDLHWRIKEGVVRALAVREARGIAAEPLIQEFLRAEMKDEPVKTELYKWAIGNTLSEVADDAVFESLANILRDQRHGKAREMVAVALGRMKDPRAVDVLIRLLKTGQVPGHALIALGKLKPAKARPYIVPYLSHEMPWIRKEAERALVKIDKAGQRTAERQSVRRKGRSSSP